MASNVCTFDCYICSKTLLLKHQERHMKWHETNSDERYSLCCTHCPQKFKNHRLFSIHLETAHPEVVNWNAQQDAPSGKLPAFHNAFVSVKSPTTLFGNQQASTAIATEESLFGLPKAESINHIAHASRVHGMQMLLKLGGVTGLYVKADPSADNPHKEVWKLTKLILKESSK